MPGSRLRLVSRAGIGYYDARYRESKDSFVTDGRDQAVGWDTTAGIEVELSGSASVILTAGYRSAVLTGFRASFFMPGDSPIKLEFSGFSGQAGLSFRF